MKLPARLRKVTRLIAFALLAVLILAVAAIELDQWVFLYRASQLKRDLQSIKLRQTTFREAQVLFQRWKGLGKYEGMCAETHCEFDIEMKTFVEKYQVTFFEQKWLLKGYAVLGGRPARLFAHIGVENGIVWGKGMFLAVNVPTENLENDFYDLIGSVGTVSRFDFSRPDYSWNTEYRIGSPSGCEGCVMLYAKFTPFADPKLIERVIDVNLSCLRPWGTCREGKDIMPGAWSQKQEDGEAHPNHNYELACDEKTVNFVARDTLSAAVFEVVKNQLKKQDDNGRFEHSIATARLLMPLKRIKGWMGSSDWTIGSDHEILIDYRSVALTETNLPSELRPGTKFILLLDRDRVESCGAIPLTPHNLDLVRRGVALDYLSPYPQLEFHNVVW